MCDGIQHGLNAAFDREVVLIGAALHDAGKIMHPEEMREPGHLHETAGQHLLIEHGVDNTLARFCVTHAAWDRTGVVVEDLLVALADKLWKGKRDDELERRVSDVIARETKRETWDVFDRLDSICEEVAADGPARLARSVV